ncbi:MAG: tetratricopeptide repeat protein [Candidatus Hydrogenedentes bacterium]|nr:tetratricopeptide repeat protein [Candidatus Hydrogenedentota bacterium]
MRNGSREKESNGKLAQIALLLAAVVVASPLAQGERIRVFVPEKPYEVSIDLKDFKPHPILQGATILAGDAEGDIIITIISEEEKLGITPSEVRAKYGVPAGADVEETKVKTSSTGEMCVLLDRKSGPSTMTKINGYAAKNDLSFDIHLSADLTKHSKEQIALLLATFQVVDSTEPADMLSLVQKLNAARNSGDVDAPLKAFVEKYPLNSWGSVMLAEHYFASEQRDDAMKAYLQALKNHRTQPIANPMTLWKCYDGLGMCCGMSGDYGASKRYFELGYELANELEADSLLAASAYNLACWYAETKDVAKCIEYLKSAIKLAPGKKADAREDASFSNLRGNEDFKALVGQ